MDVRVLEYFLALAREGSVSAAAEALHVSQPTLSRQLMALEGELGCTLFTRGRHGITLTEDGLYLRRRAGEIVSLVRATQSDLLLAHGSVAGEISIGCAETQAMRLVARVMRSLRQDHDAVTFRIVSDTAERVSEQINKGLLDFGLVLREPAVEGLSSLAIDTHERPGVLVPRESELARCPSLSMDDLVHEPLIVPSTYRESGILGGHLPAQDGGDLQVVAFYNLVFNAVRASEEGLGHVVTLEGLVGSVPMTKLAFVPLEHAIDMSSYLVWKAFALRTRACEVFLERARAELPLR